MVTLRTVVKILYSENFLRFLVYVTLVFKGAETVIEGHGLYFVYVCMFC